MNWNSALETNLKKNGAYLDCNSRMKLKENPHLSAPDFRGLLEVTAVGKCCQKFELSTYLSY